VGTVHQVADQHGDSGAARSHDIRHAYFDKRREQNVSNTTSRS